MRLFFIIAVSLLSAAVLLFVYCIHTFLITPMSLAALNLRKIRFGLPPSTLPPVRIHELQEIFNQLPGLSRHFETLNARTSSLEREKNKYINLSLIDSLTGINNRRSLELAMREEFSPAREYAALMVDVDFFKLYNDSLGHQQGDCCLATVAQTLKNSISRADDRVFRYGGEEFVIFLPYCNEKSACTVAQRIVQRVRDLRLPHPTSTIADHVTVSVGVASRPAYSDISFKELIARADKALYIAKSTGRDKVDVFTQEDAETECVPVSMGSVVSKK